MVVSFLLQVIFLYRFAHHDAKRYVIHEERHAIADDPMFLWRISRTYDSGLDEEFTNYWRRQFWRKIQRLDVGHAESDNKSVN